MNPLPLCGHLRSHSHHQGTLCCTTVRCATHTCGVLLQAVQALYISTVPVGVSQVTSGKTFSLTSADVLSQTFNAAIASFSNSTAAAAAAPAAAIGTGGGRRLAQAASAPAPSVVRETRKMDEFLPSDERLFL